MKSHDPIRSEQRLLEALRAAETATLTLRDYAATVLPPGPPAAGGPSSGEEAPARPAGATATGADSWPTPCAQPSDGRFRTGCRPSSTSASWPMNISTARAAAFWTTTTWS